MLCFANINLALCLFVAYFMSQHREFFVPTFSLLTPWRRVLEKLTISQLVKKFPWNLKVHYRVYECLPPVPFLSQLDPVHTPTSHFLKIYLNIILPSMLWSSKWCLSLWFPHQDPVYTSPLLHTCYMTRPSHSSQLNHLNNIG